MYQRLFLPTSIEGLLSFLLNPLPHKKTRHLSQASLWLVCWLIICEVLHKLDHLFHHKLPLSLYHPGHLFLVWLPCD
ncbi:MAG: hypothetical protein EXX96DRAFT_579760 [Benjaminiella poitrasii]|nr:MAG: hypothetical protein EXX96DRAFT_579760 [Benjaminiella poitrasii]